jgi:hypothetical protein
VVTAKCRDVLLVEVKADVGACHDVVEHLGALYGCITSEADCAIGKVVKGFFVMKRGEVPLTAP